MTRTHVAELVANIVPLDALEETHRDDTAAWVHGRAGIYRLRKPDVPPKHLVAYFALVDVEARAILLVDHINAQRWLPTGGHVEPDEDPRATVDRELAEELGVEGELVEGLTSNPLMVTQEVTGGLDAGHTDVSLWYVIDASIGDQFEPDPLEFHAVRWWAFAEVHSAPIDTVDQNLPRFITKLERDLERSGAR